MEDLNSCDIFWYINNITAFHRAVKLWIPNAYKMETHDKITALIVEIGEFVSCLDWKPYRSNPSEIDRNHAMEEAIDILFCIVWIAEDGYDLTVPESDNESIRDINGLLTGVEFPNRVESWFTTAYNLEAFLPYVSQWYFSEITVDSIWKSLYYWSTFVRQLGVTSLEFRDVFVRKLRGQYRRLFDGELR